MLSFIINILHLTKSLINISIDNSGSYNILFNNSFSISNACPEIIMSEYGTRLSPCNNPLYKVKYKYTNNSHLVSYLTNSTYLPEIDCWIKNITETSLLINLELSNYTYTNWISPLYSAQWTSNFNQNRILNVPMDNDLQSLYYSENVNLFTKGTSSFVSSIYNAYSYNTGLVIGFLEHNLWKTGIEYSYNTIGAVAGINGKLLTRDKEPHGEVYTNNSPTLYISYNDDWREGMEDYSEKIEMFTDHKIVKKQIPFSGWNSWAMAIGHIGEPSVESMIKTSDVMYNLTNYGLGPQQYIVRDAVYNLNNSQTKEWVSHINKYKNQFSGTYSTPFVLYASNINNTVGCDRKTCDINNSECWYIKDIVLKDKKNNPIVALLDGKTDRKILDTSHPATECIIKYDSKMYKNNNMSLVKYDFLNHAAYEGVRYNMTLTPTGISAYLYGLNLINKIWEEMNYSVILNYGISLPLPIGKGMTTRRHGCDQMFGGVMYTMNQYAGGWWLNRFYILDPDLVTFQEQYWFEPSLKKLTLWLNMDSRSRVAKAVVYGGEFKNGDDLTNTTNIAIVNTYMGNKRVNAMWSKSRTGQRDSHFRPLSWNKNKIIVPFLSEIIPPEIYVRKNGDIVIFNFGIFDKDYKINFTETNLNLNNKISCIDIWDETVTGKILNNSFNINVKGKSSVLIECRNI